MEMRPTILDFRTTGCVSKCLVIRNTHTIDIEFLVPTVSGPFVLRSVAQCEAERNASTRQPKDDARHFVRARIPPKQVVQFHVMANMKALHKDEVADSNHMTCGAWGFPVVSLSMPSESQCAVAVGSKSGDQQKVQMDKSVLSLLQEFDIPGDCTRHMLLQADAHLCEVICPNRSSSAGSDELELAQDWMHCSVESKMPSGLARLVHTPQAAPACSKGAGGSCPSVAFQAVQVEVSGREARVKKVIPIPLEPSNMACGHMVTSEIIGRKPIARFQVRGAWYDARGIALETGSLLRDQHSGTPAQSSIESKGVALKSPAIDALRSAALEAAQSELGILYLPDPGMLRHGDCKTLFPTITERRHTEAGTSKAGQLRHVAGEASCLARSPECRSKGGRR